MAACKLLVFKDYHWNKQKVEAELTRYFNAGYRMKSMMHEPITCDLWVWMEKE